MKGLPKQWLHWAAGMRIKPERTRHAYRGNYMIGRNRHWRVTDSHFQVSCELNDFDRWANSRVAELPIPKTRVEFEKTVKELLHLVSGL